MLLDTDAIKTFVDIGLGAVSLMLWLRQGKVNKKQMELDAQQNKTAEDLTLMVRDHEARIEDLEQSKIQRANKAWLKRRSKKEG